MLEENTKTRQQIDSDSDSEDELLYECDVVLKNLDEKFFVLNNKTNPADSVIGNIENTQALRFKPDQALMEIDFEIGQDKKGIKSENNIHKFTQSTHIKNSRADHYLTKFSDGQLNIYPVEKVQSIQTKFKGLNVTSEKIIQEKTENTEIKKKLLRQVESSMRNHDFQKELLNDEDWVNYKFIEPEGQNQKSFMKKLIEKLTT